MFKKALPIFGFIFITFIFFWQFFLKGLIPISSDTIVGLYYPYRDFYAKDYPRGLPFKNFLITDPVRQQYPWRSISMVDLSKKSLPTWNPFAFSGTPGIANFQSAVFYPFNIIFFLLPYIYSWSLLIIFQPLLAGIFLYLYLGNLKLDKYSSFLGGVIFAFGGFFATWLEWGTILSTALWLPLVLLSIDKIFQNKNKEKIYWTIGLILSLVFSIFAGHLQTLFYLFVFILVYFLCRLYQSKERLSFSALVSFGIFSAIFIGLIQILPTLQFIKLSGRGLDEVLWKQEGWFIPLRHLAQFLAPDFFGNPTTLNYWGAWNYGELSGYVGIGALILALMAIFYRRDKKTLFYFCVFLIAIILALPNLISKIPFEINFPFISTSQPTRLLFIIDFSLAVMAALGLNHLILKGKLKQIILPVLIVALLLLLLLGFSLTGGKFGIEAINLAVAKRNLFLPLGLFVLYFTLICSLVLLPKKFRSVVLILLIILTVADLFRFSWKFNTFSKKEYLYPATKSLEFIRTNQGISRMATADPRILAPNFQIMHGLYSVEGYDPLYIARYAELIAAINRGKPNINPPFGFNRIIRVENYSSPLVNLLGIKFVMSLTDMNQKGFEKVYQEGETKVYENKNVVPRAFFVNKVVSARNKQDAISKMFNSGFSPLSIAVVEGLAAKDYSAGSVEVQKYSNDEVIIVTKNNKEGFMVLTDVNYPTWHAMIDNQQIKIYQTDFAFRGLVIPAGEHTVIFKNSLL